MKPQMGGREGGTLPPLQSYETHQGLMAGSFILTLDGEIAVEDLVIGQRIITRDSGMAILRTLRVRQIQCDTVLIKAGSLGHTPDDNRPAQDVVLPIDQKLLVRDWRAKAVFSKQQALVSAGSLVDGEFVTLVQAQQRTVFEIEFDQPHILYVDGLEVVSYFAETQLADAA